MEPDTRERELHSIWSNRLCQQALEWSDLGSVESECARVRGAAADVTAPAHGCADYYAARAELVLNEALGQAAKGQPMNDTVLSRILAQHAYNWTTASNEYPTSPVGDALQVSMSMFEKYSAHFSGCATVFPSW